MPLIWRSSTNSGLQCRIAAACGWSSGPVKELRKLPLSILSCVPCHESFCEQSHQPQLYLCACTCMFSSTKQVLACSHAEQRWWMWLTHCLPVENNWYYSFLISGQHYGSVVTMVASMWEGPGFEFFFCGAIVKSTNCLRQESEVSKKRTIWDRGIVEERGKRAPSLLSLRSCQWKRLRKYVKIYWLWVLSIWQTCFPQ